MVRDVDLRRVDMAGLWHSRGLLAYWQWQNHRRRGHKWWLPYVRCSWRAICIVRIDTVMPSTSASRVVAISRTIARRLWLRPRPTYTAPAIEDVMITLTMLVPTAVLMARRRVRKQRDEQHLTADAQHGT